jgi:hypothetical protein
MSSVSVASAKDQNLFAMSARSSFQMDLMAIRGAIGAGRTGAR